MNDYQPCERNTPIFTICSNCKSEKTLFVAEDDYRDWIGGKLVQNCFPYLSAADRERLIPSRSNGLCGDCFDEIIRDTDDIDEYIGDD